MVCFRRHWSVFLEHLFKHRRLCLATALFLVLVVWTWAQEKLPSMGFQKIVDYVRSVRVEPELWQGHQACQHPYLDAHSPGIMRFVEDVGPIVCHGENDWVEVDGDLAYVTQEVQREHQGVSCDFTDVKRFNDFFVWPISTTYNVTQYRLTRSDFVRVQCRGLSGEKWSNILAGARYDEGLMDSTGWTSPSNAMKLNVLMFGFDSVSRLNFIRKLPKSYEFLVNEINATILTGYNIVGDGTPQAIIPMLTGKTERELPEARKRKGRRASFVNAYPFIWSHFRDAGYVTGFMEDTPNTGIFTYRLRGFNSQPTDFYMRTFFLDAEPNYYPSSSDHCLGSRPRHTLMMNYIKNMFKVYKNRPKFSFGFQGEISHNDMNMVGAADHDLLDWLKWYKKEHWRDTVLILMSDHGSRFGRIRNTQQGKLEERLPFFSFTFPPSFGKYYPEALKNFKTNANRLTTPFDIHATLASFLEPPSFGKGNLSHRAISLFQEIPASRTCVEAFIEPHWCACLDWESLDKDDNVVYQAAEALVRRINENNAWYTDQCGTIRLIRVTWAAKLVPSAAFRKFSGSKDEDGMIPDMSANTAVVAVVYQLKIVTDPGPAIFEAAVSHDQSSLEFKIKMEEISRLNEYGAQARCVERSHEHLRKFCYCKN